MKTADKRAVQPTLSGPQQALSRQDPAVEQCGKCGVKEGGSDPAISVEGRRASRGRSRTVFLGTLDLV